MSESTASRAPAGGLPGVNPWAPAAVGIAALLAHLACSVSHSNWCWGINHFFWLGLPWTIILVGAGCLLCLPPVWAGLTRISGLLARSGIVVRRHPLNDVVIAGLAAVGFWLLRTRLQFLGDGRLITRLLDQGNWFRPTELLDRWIHHAVLEATRRIWNWDASTVHAVLSVAAGFVFVLAALRLGAVLRHKLFAASALISLGLVQLFLGYAEVYSLATAAILVYMLLAVEFVSGRRRLAWVGLSLLVGVALHNALLFLAPSFVYLMIARTEKTSKQPRGRRLEGAAFLAATLALAAFCYAAGHAKAGPRPLMLLPIVSDPAGQYAILSWKHLVDFVNEQLLISPTGWIAAAAMAVALWKDRAARQSRRFRFLAIAAAFPLAFNLVIRPDLGGSRDWDMWSMGSLPYLVAAVSWIASLMAKRRDARFAAYVMVVVGLVHVTPWIAVNRSPRLSIDRFARIAEDNPLWRDARMAAAQSELGHFYIEQEMNAEAAGHLRRAAELDPGNARYWDALGVAYLGLKRIPEAERALRRATELDPDDATAYNNLGRAYYVLGRLDEAEAALRRSLALDPKSGPSYYNLGKIYAARGDLDSAIAAYDQATRVWPFVPEYWRDLAAALEQAGRPREAAEARRKSGTSY